MKRGKDEGVAVLSVRRELVSDLLELANALR